MAKFFVTRVATDVIEVEADDEAGALEQALNDDFSNARQVDTDWSVEEA